MPKASVQIQEKTIFKQVFFFFFISIAGHCDLKYIIKCIVIYYNSLYL